MSLRFSASNGFPPAAGRRPSAAELAESHGLLLVDLTAVEIEPDAAAEIPVRVLERVRAVPYRFAGNRLRVAIADPGDLRSTSSGSPAVPRSSSWLRLSTRSVRSCAG